MPIRIRAGRTVPQRGYKTAKQQIEETPRIATHEMGWVKTRGGERLIPVVASQDRKPRSAHIRSIEALLEAGARSFTHTHYGKLDLPWLRNFRANPSQPDLRNLHRFTELNKKPFFFHIASLTRNGTVKGYTSFRFTKRFFESPYVAEFIKAKLAPDVLMKFFGIGVTSESRVRTNKKLKDLLLRGLLELRYTPMPGYEIDEKKKIFVKSKK